MCSPYFTTVMGGLVGAVVSMDKKKETSNEVEN
jgi:hypothetical protein